MKIFLTEFEMNNMRFPGPNIVAASWEVAEQAAADNNLILVGELDNICVDSTGSYSYKDLPQERTIH
jgi:hypothetical protein